MKLFVPRETENGDNLFSRQAQLKISEKLKKTEEMTVARVITSDSSQSDGASTKHYLTNCLPNCMKTMTSFS